MQLADRANVYTADGERVGEIDRVVIDPRTREVTHLVVEKGFLFTEDRVVPLSLVGPATGDKVVLREDAGDLDQLPHFRESYYVATETMVQPTAEPPTGIGSLYWYPPVASRWASPSYKAEPASRFVEQQERSIKNIPEGTVAMKEGAAVVSSEEEHVGDIERIFTASPEERVTHLLISQGLLLKEEKLVPVTWITDVLENEVHLSVDAEYIDSLPEYDLED